MSWAINVSDLCFSYGNGNMVFDHLDFSINNHESVAIIGANGTGKSTLLRILVGLLDYHGEIEVAGLRLNKNNLAKIRKEIGFVFQDSNNQLFMPTLYDDMAFGLRNAQIPDEKAEELIDEALAKVDITYLKNRSNHKMSGGERKLAAIATILAMKPGIILFDEPSIALDPYNRRNLINILNSIENTKVIATHDLDLAYETCERGILLSPDGKMFDGDLSELFNDEALLNKCHLEPPLFMQKAKRKGNS